MINLKKLHYATVLVEEGTFAAAANRLNISQSALSRSIQALEEYHSIKLFDRDNIGTKLTSEGANFLKLAGDLLRIARYTEYQMQHITNYVRKEPIKFGMGPVSSATLLPDMLLKLTNDGSRLEMRVGSNSDLDLLLKHGEIDFFVGYVMRGEDSRSFVSDLEYYKVPMKQWGLLVRNDHPLFEEEITRSSISRYPVASGSFVRDTLPFSTFEVTGLQRPTIESDDYVLLTRLTRDSDYVLIASRILAIARPDLGLACLPIELEFEDQHDWALIYSAERKLSPAADRAASLILSWMEETAKEATSSGESSSRK